MSPKPAAAWLSRKPLFSDLRAQCHKLAALEATVGRPRPELRADIRSFPFKDYVIFFRYHAGRFEVVNILEDTGISTPTSATKTNAERESIEGYRMARENPHIGSSFESWLEEKGLREEATATAIEVVIADQIAAAMKERAAAKTHRAALMQTSRAKLDRLLDPDNSGTTLETLMRAAKAVGRELRLELV